MDTPPPDYEAPRLEVLGSVEDLTQSFWVFETSVTDRGTEDPGSSEG